MSFETWLTFAIGSFLICATPGPNMLLVFVSSVKHGFKKSFLTMAGCLSAVCLLIMLSVMGVGALLAASPDAFRVLKILGAAYLIYVGVKTCISDGMIKAPDTSGITDKTLDVEIFRKGFLVGISNPKAILFAVAFFSQFVDPSRPQFAQLAILFTTFIVIECGCYLAYATGGRGLAKFLHNQLYQRIFNCIIGLLFITFGILLLFYKMH